MLKGLSAMGEGGQKFDNSSDKVNCFGNVKELSFKYDTCHTHIYTQS